MHIDKPTDLYLENFILEIKNQLVNVAVNNGTDIINKLSAYASTFESSTNTELGIPTGNAPIIPDRAALDKLLLKYAIPATVSPPIINCPCKLFKKISIIDLTIII